MGALGGVHGASTAGQTTSTVEPTLAPERRTLRANDETKSWVWSLQECIVVSINFDRGSGNESAEVLPI